MQKRRSEYSGSNFEETYHTTYRAEALITQMIECLECLVEFFEEAAQFGNSPQNPQIRLVRHREFQKNVCGLLSVSGQRRNTPGQRATLPGESRGKLRQFIALLECFRISAAQRLTDDDDRMGACISR